MAIFSREDWDFWKENGYVVVPNAVPRENLDAMVNTICVPGFHNMFEDWVKTQPEDRHPRHPDLDGLEVKSIPGKAGDLIIWHRLLAHGNGHNRSDRPRLAQYIRMYPVASREKDALEDRIAAWQNCRPTSRWPGDPRDWEHKTQKPAKLTDLGKKLLGVETWN